MSGKALFRRVAAHEFGAVLWPADDDGRAMLRAMPATKEVMVHLHAPRNPRHHRLLFALLRMVIDGGAWEGDEESLLDAIKMETRLVRPVARINGEIVLVPRSIAFESMDQEHFNRWFERAVFVIASTLLGGMDWEELRDQVIEAADGELGARARGRVSPDTLAKEAGRDAA